MADKLKVIKVQVFNHSDFGGDNRFIHCHAAYLGRSRWNTNLVWLDGPFKGKKDFIQCGFKNTKFWVELDGTEIIAKGVTTEKKQALAA